MGNSITSWFGPLLTREKAGFLMFGLDDAGKSSIAFKLQLGEVVQSTPTEGFTVETLEYRNVKITVWDVGGDMKIRPFFRHFYKDFTHLILVVDSSDRERIRESKIELNKMLEEEELQGLPLLVFASKNDLQNVLKSEEIVKELDLNSIRNRSWYIQSCSSSTGNGLYEGLEWISNSKYTPQRFNTAKSARSVVN